MDMWASMKFWPKRHDSLFFSSSSFPVNKRQCWSCFGLFYCFSREFWVTFDEQQCGLFKTERHSFYPTWRKRSNSEWPDTGESFWRQIKTKKYFIFSLLQSDKVFGIKNLFSKIFNAVFSEQSCPTAMSFLLTNKWFQDSTLFPNWILHARKLKHVHSCLQGPRPPWVVDGKHVSRPLVKEHRVSANETETYVMAVKPFKVYSFVNLIQA